jgi:hypothetical protein
VAAEEPERNGLTPEMRECIEAASDCYSVSAETLSYSLDGGQYLDPAHLRVLIDLCEVCQATQNTMLRGSGLSVMLAAVCVEACEKAAESCRQLNGSDEQLASCAEMCDATADRCRKVGLL